MLVVRGARGSLLVLRVAGSAGFEGDSVINSPAIAPGAYFLRLASSRGDQVTERVTSIR